jgi:hypothetical protein
MQKWEYKVEYKNINGRNAIMEYLNFMGEQGWENYMERDRIYYFKRPFPDTKQKPESSCYDQEYNEKVTIMKTFATEHLPEIQWELSGEVLGRDIDEREVVYVGNGVGTNGKKYVGEIYFVCGQFDDVKNIQLCE